MATDATANITSANVPRMDVEYQNMINNTAKALTNNQAEAAQLANDAYNASMQAVQGQAESATNQNDITYQQARGNLNNQFGGYYPVQNQVSETTLNKLSTAAAQAQGAINLGRQTAELGAQRTLDNSNYAVQNAYLSNLNKAQQQLGQAGITAAENQRTNERNFNYARDEAIANRAMRLAEQEYQRQQKEQQNDLNMYAKTIMRFDSTSACDKEIARLKKSKDPQRQQKIEYVEAQKAAILAGAYAKQSGSGGSGRGRSGRRRSGGSGNEGYLTVNNNGNANRREEVAINFGTIPVKMGSNAYEWFMAHPNATTDQIANSGLDDRSQIEVVNAQQARQANKDNKNAQSVAKTKQKRAQQRSNKQNTKAKAAIQNAYIRGLMG